MDSVSSGSAESSVTSSPATPVPPRFRNRCRWNQDPDSKRKCRGSATVLHRNAGVCETCLSLRARWTARLVAEYPSAMSRSQLNTLLDKHMDLNRCRQILEQRKASAAGAPLPADALEAGSDGEGRASSVAAAPPAEPASALDEAAQAKAGMRMPMLVGKEFERIFGGLFRGKGAGDAGGAAGAGSDGLGPLANSGSASPSTSPVFP